MNLRVELRLVSVKTLFHSIQYLLPLETAQVEGGVRNNDRGFIVLTLLLFSTHTFSLQPKGSLMSKEKKTLTRN